MKKLLILILTLNFIANHIGAQKYETYRKLIDTTFVSTNLGFEKNITVTVPFEWQANIDKDFPLIIIFDQQNPRSHSYMINTIDYLTINDQMPASVIISIESEQQYRYWETLHIESNPKGKATENERFLFEEIIPLAEEKFHASAFRLFIGHSRYGYFTTSLFMSKINELNAVISISPFFTQKKVNLVDSISELNNVSLNSTKYFRYAIGNDYPDDFYQMDSILEFKSNKRFNAKGVLFERAYHNVTPGLTIAQSLYEIFEYWSENQNKYFDNSNKGPDIISGLEKNIYKHYGSNLNFSIGILNGKGWYFFNESKFEKAIMVWEKLLEDYPNFSEGYLAIIQAQSKLNQDNTNTIEAFKKNLENSDFYSESEKLGLLHEFKN